MNFLPQNYELPTSSGNYLKLEDGENRIRILSFPILGWEDWDNKTPVRYRYENKPSVSIDPKKPYKHFWSMICWNYVMSSIQIFHVTQGTIKKALDMLSKDVDWGAPFHYDIKIYKTGDGMETKYALTPVSPKPLTQEILDAFAKKPCDLEALFSNSDPFQASNRVTPLAIHQDASSKNNVSSQKNFDAGYNTIAPSVSPDIHVQNAKNLDSMIHNDDKEYKDRILNWFKVDSLEKLTPEQLKAISPEIYERFQKRMKDEAEKKAV